MLRRSRAAWRRRPFRAAAGTRVVEVGSGPTRETALAALARGVGSPPHVGTNLDALADGLREAARTPLTLVWHVDPALPARDADRIAEVLAFVEDETTERGARAGAGTGAGPLPRFRAVVVRD